jgi:hypothetical protein
MNKKSIIHSTTVLCSLVIFLVLAIFARSSNITSKNPTDPNSKQAVKSKNEKYNELLQLKESTIKQRNEVIEYLLNIIKSDKHNYNDTFAAIDILGQIRAIEATDILLDMVDYKLPIAGMSLPSLDPIQSGKRYPVVKALVNIRPKYENILKKIQNENNLSTRRCYIAVMVGVEGVDISRYLIEKAIKKETDRDKLSRLSAALNLLNKDFPPDSNDVKQKSFYR